MKRTKNKKMSCSEETVRSRSVKSQFWGRTIVSDHGKDFKEKSFFNKVYSFDAIR